MRMTIATLLFVFMLPTNLCAQNLKVPPSFEVVEFADGKLANDIHVMTVDPKGRVVVAGRGYIRILVDDDGDGKADRALDFTAQPKDGAMGLLWEGDTLYVMGDGGLRRFTAKKNGDKADGPSELIRALKTGGEHSSHAIRRGPDGWLYVLCGNNAGIDKSYADLPTSPIKEPTAGCVLRFHPDLKKCEIVAHGFRNPYSMDFNLAGDLFTFDSDNERCVSLPWYEPTRFYHVIEGRHYGWLNPQHAAFWRRPPYFCDVVAPIATLGRGSPTGVACYRHNQFPPEYHGGFFLADWTFGKIHFATLQRKGASYTAKTRVFLESLGDNGFAPTACAVDPKTGDLYVSIGGRGTRGAVYRIRHPERFKAMTGKLAPLKMATLTLELNEEDEKLMPPREMPRLLWGLQMYRRHQVYAVPTGDKLYTYPDVHIQRATADWLADILRVFPKKDFLDVKNDHLKLLKEPGALKGSELRKHLTMGLAFSQHDSAVMLEQDRSLKEGDAKHLEALVQKLGSNVYSIRESAKKALMARGPVALPFLRGALSNSPLEMKRLAQRCISEIEAMMQSEATAAVAREFAHQTGVFVLARTKRPEYRIQAIRLVQLGLGDIGAKKSIGTIWEGYSSRREIKDDETAKKLALMFPSSDADLDRELSRTLGMLSYADADLRLRVLAKCNADSSPIDDIHYLACYARLNGKRADKEAKLIASALLDLDRKIVARKLNRDSNWPLRVQELYVGLSEKDASLQKAMVEHPAFGRAEHALFANTAGFPKERAARIFLERWKLDPKYALTGNIVQLFDTLPAEDVLPTLRNRWGSTGQENALLPLLARKPEANDRGKFLDGLNSVQTSVLVACVQGLDKLDGKSDANESFALIRALHRTSDASKPAPNGARLAKMIAERLDKTTGQAFGTDSKRWIAWLDKEHPEFGKRLANPDGVDVAKWDQRLARLDWTAGNADTGKAVFSKTSCIQCHSGAQAIGPDLVGVGTRFSRADLFTAILQPSKDVPARYQTTVVETREGKTYQGIVIYDAVDSLILQTGASTTVRLDGASVVSRHVSPQSLMPAGLLDALSDREIVDLYGYLRSLGKTSAN
jgi:putative membrane-bound dehydrogenase-like protein